MPTLSKSFLLYPLLPPVASVCVQGPMISWWWGSKAPGSMCGSLFFLNSSFTQFLCLLLVNSWLIHLICWGPDVSAYRLSSTLALAGVTDPHVRLVPPSPCLRQVTPQPLWQVFLHPSSWQPHCWLTDTQLSFHQMPCREGVCAVVCPGWVGSHWPEIYYKSFFYSVKWSAVKCKF